MTLRAILMRVRASFTRRSAEAVLNDEVRTHLELLAVEYERRGLSPEQARHAARRDFGGVEQMKEHYRDRRGLPWLDDVRRDVQHGFRALLRAPVFAGAAMLTLAVGLTAVIAISAILNAFMFRPMPVDRPEELVSIGTGPDDRHVSLPHGISFLDLQDFRQEHACGARGARAVHVAARGQPVRSVDLWRRLAAVDRDLSAGVVHSCTARDTSGSDPPRQPF